MNNARSAPATCHMPHARCHMPHARCQMPSKGQGIPTKGACMVRNVHITPRAAGMACTARAGPLRGPALHPSIHPSIPACHAMPCRQPCPPLPTSAPPSGWCSMMRACGRQRRSPGAPAASSCGHRTAKRTAWQLLPLSCAQPWWPVRSTAAGPKQAATSHQHTIPCSGLPWALHSPGCHVCLSVVLPAVQLLVGHLTCMRACIRSHPPATPCLQLALRTAC